MNNSPKSPSFTEPSSRTSDSTGEGSGSVQSNIARPLTLTAQENNDPVNDFLQRCVPILEDKIKCMHQDLSLRLDSLEAAQKKTNDLIARLVTGQASISLNISVPGAEEEQGRSHTISTTPTPQISFPGQERSSSETNAESSLGVSFPERPHQSTTVNDNPVPLYCMNRSIVSINDLWREWTEGLSGGYAIIDLERRWGTKWRREEKEKKFFNRRRLIIDEIKKYANSKNITIETAIDIAERRRSQRGRSLHWLSKNKDMIFET